MKIGILTQPLQNNYGGLLQAYALQKVLKDMGHEVWTVDSQFKKRSFRSRLVVLFKRFILKMIFNRKDIETIIPIRPNYSEIEYMQQHFISFKSNKMRLTQKTTLDDLNQLVEEYGFQTIIVGSDQVWRPKYSPNIAAYFLSTLQHKPNLKRIAYGASFGTDVWEFSKSQTKKYRDLIKQFNLVTVREESAMHLCKNKFDIDATVVLDPTLLIRTETYIELFTDKISIVKEDYILVYVLDKSRDLSDAVIRIASELKCSLKIIEPEKPLDKDYSANLNDYVLPPVEQWISDIKNAKFVITDSFHGSVFSILFQKLFLSLGNHKRGLSRFESLLNILKLQERLILNPIDITSDKLRHKIDYDSVEKILERERNISLNVLNKHLKEN